MGAISRSKPAIIARGTLAGAVKGTNWTDNSTVWTIEQAGG
jgi:hypothetical protein